MRGRTAHTLIPAFAATGTQEGTTARGTRPTPHPDTETAGCGARSHTHAETPPPSFYKGGIAVTRECTPAPRDARGAPRPRPRAAQSGARPSRPTPDPSLAEAKPGGAPARRGRDRARTARPARTPRAPRPSPGRLARAPHLADELPAPVHAPGARVAQEGGDRRAGSARPPRPGLHPSGLGAQPRPDSRCSGPAPRGRVLLAEGGGGRGGGGARRPRRQVCRAPALRLPPGGEVSACPFP